jgi:membrane protein implicated in regulation of membrane protease activity
MTTIFFYWLILALLFLLGEVGHPGLFFFISFALGACASAGASLWVSSLITQSLVFLCVTIVSIILIHLILVRHEEVHIDEDYHSNIDALVGKRAIVVQVIKPSLAGRVQIDGEQWAARAETLIVEGTITEVVAVCGAHVKVRILNQ